MFIDYLFFFRILEEEAMAELELEENMMNNNNKKAHSKAPFPPRPVKLTVDAALMADAVRAFAGALHNLGKFQVFLKIKKTWFN